MSMKGIDISGHQKGIYLAAVPCDFVIIKATQGSSFVSDDFKRQIEQALDLEKLVGVYHYANGIGVEAEASHFVETISPYLGKVILALDWEGDQNRKFSDYQYCENLLEAIRNKTGVTPFLYMSKSVARQYKWEVARNYPIWIAQYKLVAPKTYTDQPWTDNKGWGPWDGCSIFQYSSVGRLPGYSKNLDLDICYLTASEWMQYAGGKNDSVVDLNDEPILKYGDRNDFVRAWQVLLNANGFPCGNSDGVFGDKTLKSLVKWQQAHDMESGFIGPQTWATIK